jgi:hypothetical protein
VIAKYEQPFREEYLPDRPNWNSKEPAIMVRPPTANSYYGRAGDLCDYDDGYIEYKDAQGFYRVVYPGVSFFAELKPIQYEGGRSAANIRFMDVNRGFSYLMAVDPAMKLIVDAMEHNRSSIEGEFSLVKRGSNFRLIVKD